MGWLDRLLGRVDGPLALPELALGEQPKGVRSDAAANLVTGLGSPQFDKSQKVRPVPRAPLTDEECWFAYQHGGLIRRAIQLRTGDATRRGWRIETPDSIEDPLAQAWQDLGVTSAVREALRWSMVFKGAALLMVMGDAENDTRQHMQPLQPGSKLVRLEVVQGPDLTPSRWATNMRRPEVWNVQVAPMGSTFQVHHSRLLLFPGLDVPTRRLADFDGLGQSYIDAVWEAIAQDEQVNAAGATLASEMKQAILKIKGMADLATEDQAELINLRLKALVASMGTLGVMLMDTEDQFETRGAPQTGYRELSEASRTRVAAWLGIPQAKLFGVAPGGMSTDDKAQMSNWRDVVADVQETRIRPALERLAEVMFEGGSGAPAQWALEFEALDEPTEMEQADIELKHAQADALRVQTGVVDPDHIARSRFQPRGYSAHIMPLSEEELDAMRDPFAPDDEDREVLRGSR